MKSIIVAILTFLVTFSNGNSQEITWYSWNEGYEIAKKENKPMLVFVHADWCHLCQRMLSKTFTDQEVISTINKDYVAIKFNFENEREKNLTYKFVEKDITLPELMGFLWNAEKGQPIPIAVPTTVFININEKKSEQVCGFMIPSDYTIELNNYISKTS